MASFSYPKLCQRLLTKIGIYAMMLASKQNGQVVPDWPKPPTLGEPVKLIRFLVNKVKWLYRHKWGLCLALLVVAGLLSIDWSSMQDDLPPQVRVHMEDCVSAQRALGEHFRSVRPDCVQYLPPPSTSR